MCFLGNFEIYTVEVARAGLLVLHLFLPASGDRLHDKYTCDVPIMRQHEKGCI